MNAPLIVKLPSGLYLHLSQVTRVGKVSGGKVWVEFGIADTRPDATNTILLTDADGEALTSWLGGACIDLCKEDATPSPDDDIPF